MSDRRMLLVHAHPDDETIGTGATMAKYAAEGAQVTLVTCTLGEEGEVLVPELAHLAADQTDGLGQHRIGELAEACKALGVTDHRFLGGPGRYRDSGMMGTEPNERPDCFWQADLAEATAHLVEVIKEVRPQVVITYDDNGGYGHPDHIQAHRVTMAAVEASAGQPWEVAKTYWTAFPRSSLQAGIDAMRAAGQGDFFGMESADDFPFCVDDAAVTTEIDAGAHVERKFDAMRAHATQITTDGPFFALADHVGMHVMGTEYFRLVRGPKGPGEGEWGRERDLFAGI